MYPETTLPITAYIPHAGHAIPTRVRDQFLPGAAELWQELVALTDWYTDELFGLPGIAASQTPINRLVVDLERFTDDTLEEKAVVGKASSIHTTRWVNAYGAHCRIGKGFNCLSTTTGPGTTSWRSIWSNNYYAGGIACCWTATVFPTNPLPMKMTAVVRDLMFAWGFVTATRLPGYWPAANGIF
jgi:hypothetical protein